jgi:hypothetical protein
MANKDVSTPVGDSRFISRLSFRRFFKAQKKFEGENVPLGSRMAIAVKQTNSQRGAERENLRLSSGCRCHGAAKAQLKGKRAESGLYGAARSAATHRFGGKLAN